jgi:hypothetical protein
MNKEKDKELDDFFRKGLHDPVDPVFRENDWSSLEQLLKKSKKPKGIVYWLPYLSSVAALLLLFVGWWSFRPKPALQSQSQVAVQPRKPAGIGTPAASDQQAVMHGQSTPHLAEQREIAKATIPQNNNKGSLNPSPGGLHRELAGMALQPGPNKQLAALTQTKRGSDEKSFADREFARLTLASPKPAFENELVSQQAISGHDIPNEPGLDVPAKTKSASRAKISSRPAFRPQYALTVLAAPDLNGVGSFQQGKVGANVGLQFSAGLSKKFTITTGIIYSAKPYLTDFDSYHTLYKFPVSPVNITADCRMLDIPLNIGYQVYNKRQNKISVGTGLSSYLMLHENYTFNYAGSNSAYGFTSPTNYTVPHSGNYLMSVLNLNATYERPLNSKIDIAVEPYIKLPLTNIGYSRVRLQSTGVALGLKWNLNSSAKP